MTATRKAAAIGAAFGAMCLMAAAPAPSGTAQEQVAAAAMSGRVLTKFELDRIFSGRTWYWKAGAAYFARNRTFRAWDKGGSETTYAEGSWSASSNGQLCIRATWHSLSGDTDAFTCYLHRTSNAIYQRELPRGSWYLFGHIPSQPGDEIRKLERGDHVSTEYLRAKRYVIGHSQARHRSAPKELPGAPR